MLDWLLDPIDPSRLHDVGWHLSWHARLMTLGWGVLVPVGILAARYMKVTPWQDWPRELDNRTWWTLHRGCHYSTLLLTLGGLALILSMPEPPSTITQAVLGHRWLGWSTAALLLVQIALGLARGTKGGPSDPRGVMRGDHFDMTARRRLFEVLHKTFGYTALLAGCAAIASGLWQANAPRWMWVIITLWWAALLVAVALIRRLTPQVSTYAAIWGHEFPDRSPDEPGGR